MQQLVLREQFDVFRRVQTRESLANVKPMVVKLKPAARVVRVKPRAHPPCKSACLAEYGDRLVEAGMIYHNGQAITAGSR